MLVCGGIALLGFPLDAGWHALFGEDVTLWGPTHLFMIGGAGVSPLVMDRIDEHLQAEREALRVQPRGQQFTENAGIRRRICEVREERRMIPVRDTWNNLRFEIAKDGFERLAALRW